MSPAPAPAQLYLPVEEWTLCGVRRMPHAAQESDFKSTEDPSLVSCRPCLILMRPVVLGLAKKPVSRATAAPGV